MSSSPTQAIHQSHDGDCAASVLLVHMQCPCSIPTVPASIALPVTESARVRPMKIPSKARSGAGMHVKHCSRPIPPVPMLLIPPTAPAAQEQLELEAEVSQLVEPLQDSACVPSTPMQLPECPDQQKKCQGDKQQGAAVLLQQAKKTAAKVWGGARAALSGCAAALSTAISYMVARGSCYGGSHMPAAYEDVVVLVVHNSGSTACKAGSGGSKLLAKLRALASFKDAVVAVGDQGRSSIHFITCSTRVGTLFRSQ